MVEVLYIMIHRNFLYSVQLRVLSPITTIIDFFRKIFFQLEWLRRLFFSFLRFRYRTISTSGAHNPRPASLMWQKNNGTVDDSQALNSTTVAKAAASCACLLYLFGFYFSTILDKDSFTRKSSYIDIVYSGFSTPASSRTNFR